MLFINGANDYQEGKNQNTLRDQDIEKIVSAYDRWEDQEKFCRVVDIKEIRENDFNLNIARFIDSAEEEDQIDVADALAELRQLEEERTQIEASMYEYLKELGYNE